MALLILPSLLKTLVYPAALTAFGLVGNAYILGSQINEVKEQIKDVRDDLGGQIKNISDDLAGQINEMKGVLKDTKEDIRDLMHRQTDIELHDMALLGKLVMDCGKKR